MGFIFWKIMYCLFAALHDSLIVWGFSPLESMVPWNKPAIAKDTAKEPKITVPLGAFVRATSIFDQMLRVVRLCAEA